MGTVRVAFYDREDARTKEARPWKRATGVTVDQTAGSELSERWEPSTSSMAFQNIIDFTYFFLNIKQFVVWILKNQNPPSHPMNHPLTMGAHYVQWQKVYNYKIKLEFQPIWFWYRVLVPV